MGKWKGYEKFRRHGGLSRDVGVYAPAFSTIVLLMMMEAYAVATGRPRISQVVETRWIAVALIVVTAIMDRLTPFVIEISKGVDLAPEDIPSFVRSFRVRGNLTLLNETVARFTEAGWTLTTSSFVSKRGHTIAFATLARTAQ